MKITMKLIKIVRYSETRNFPLCINLPSMQIN